MFCFRDPSALKARVKALEEELSSADESCAAWAQKAQTAEHRLHIMELHRSADGLTNVVMGLAEEIENIFARGGDGRLGRLKQVSSVVRRGIEMALLGEKNWKT